MSFQAGPPPMTNSPFPPLLLLTLAVLLAGALLSLLAWRRSRLAHLIGAAASIGGALLGLIAAFGFLHGGTVSRIALPWNAAGVAFTLVLDSLAAFFLVPLFLLYGVCALYAVRYLETRTHGLQAARHWFAFALLGVSMTLVVCAANALAFLVAWETMALSSFLLVVHNLRDEQSRRAGWTYLIATRLGTVFLFLLFLKESTGSGSLDFGSLAYLPPGTAVVFFLLGLVGFGTKAGLFPLHSWLPDAHAAAPSHVSALMSGVMIKTAIYALLRLLTILPPLPSWCGLLLTVLGISGALFGITMAIMQSDLKRSLAYSTVENIGIIFLALGVWLYCRSAGSATAATLALAGGLLHIWNHALFKGTLFLGAGSILHATGTREMSAMGGLMKRMPQTGLLMLTGGAAISALPPANGLISELLIYLSLLRTGQESGGATAFFFMLLVILLAMTGSLVLLTISRIIGIIFNGAPRGAEPGDEAPLVMRLAMTLPALLCLVIGILPGQTLSLLAAPLTIIDPDAAAPLTALSASLPFGPAWSLSGILFVALGAIVIARRVTGNKAMTASPTWGCGYGRPNSRMAYTACGFAQLVQDEVACACLRPDIDRTGDQRLFPGPLRHVQLSVDPVLKRAIVPLFARLADRAHACRALQAGQLGIYLSYFFVTVILLLGWIVLSSRG